MTNNPIYSKDDTVFAVLIGIRFILNRAPLFICYIPSLGAVYDKIDQCAIFKRSIVVDVKDNTEDNKENNTKENNTIDMSDVAWWDCISDKWQLLVFNYLRNRNVVGYNRKGKELSGKYLFTCDPQSPRDYTDYGQSEVWHEHKTKTFFFDDKTGVLCCLPNNKMRLYDMSLSPDRLDNPSWLKVYKDSDSPDRISHENAGNRLGDTDSFDYKLQ